MVHGTALVVATPILRTNPLGCIEVVEDRLLDVEAGTAKKAQGVVEDNVEEGLEFVGARECG